LIGGKLLNENEHAHRLKYLHAKYVLEDESKEENFADLFGDKVPFNYVPIDIAGIYGAYDTIKTYELYLFQDNFLSCDRKDMRKISHVMHDIEMPLIPILMKMELRGIKLDRRRAKELETIFTGELIEVTEKLNNFVAKYDEAIKGNPTLARLAYKKGTLELNYNSPPQVKEFIYDILKCDCVSWKYVKGTKTPEYGTGEDIVKKLKEKYPKISFFDDLLRFRGISKLLNTYIVKMQNIADSEDIIHCIFNQYGAATGRFSSQDPNLQNIPAHEKRIRTMFVARDGFVLASMDYSQIEPRTLASLSGDETMRGAYLEGEDLYSELASFIFEKLIEECGDGTEERSATKGVLLGIMYDRTPESVAAEFKKSTSWGREVVGKFFNRFPKVKNFVDFSVYEAETLGYVTTIDGRKRRLPDIQKDRTSAAYKQAHRQVVNSRIQGSAGDIMKKAMINIDRDERLKKYEVYMLITIHDELIFEIKEEDVAEVIPIIEENMLKAGEDTIDVPCKVDTEITKVWYGEKLNKQYLEVA
jgi:DNA polymerase I-like protein with 3'-5' exonuclease and polymerase domains